MLSQGDHPAIQCLQSFFSEMFAWETEATRFHEAIDWEKITQAQFARDAKKHRAKLEQIFERFCEVGSKAKRLQDRGFSHRVPPEYDSAQTEVVSVFEKGRKLIVDAKDTRPGGWIFRYELVETPKGWRLRDSRKRRSDNDTKWRSDLL